MDHDVDSILCLFHACNIGKNNKQVFRMM